ncbi:hypothetical protein PthstB1num2_19100 [Parageobacillus thermoglucosidasius]|nr:hypothetical protein PthstB1num2_19100 [Parageobacillus thermoglucosidasius]
MEQEYQPVQLLVKMGLSILEIKRETFFSIYLKDLENAPKYDGTVYDEENDHWVRNDIADILDKSEKSWRVHTRTGAWINTVIVGKDGTIFVGDSEGYVLHAYHPNGQLKWQMDLGEHVYDLAIGYALAGSSIYTIGQK